MKKRSVIISSIFLLFVFSMSYNLLAAPEGRVVVMLTGETVKENSCGAVLESTGIGKAPKGRGMAQSKLMAERAAKVRAYRNLVQAVDSLNTVLPSGSGSVSTTGFIKGARIVEKKYLPDGQVEIKIALDVNFMNQNDVCRDWVIHKVSHYGFSVYEVDTQTTEISENEWVEWNH
jgi:hypothetical protein